MNKVKMFAAATVVAGSLFAVSAPASAQTLGFKLGPTWSTVDRDGDNNEDPKYLQSLGGGGFLRFGLMGLAMQGEVLAITKGYELESTQEFQYQLEYVEVPVMARFGLGTNAAFSPYVMVGPSFGFNYACNMELGDTDTDCGDDIKKLDIGVAGVAGLEFAAGPGNILVEGRYTHGLSNVNNTEIAGDMKNRSFGVMAGYAITLTR